jgi:carbon monoxide dehydrogenase subunit G
MKGRLFTATTDIEAPMAKVFEYLSEPELCKSWVPGLVEVEITNPGVGVGSSSITTFRLNGRTMKAMERIIESDPPTSIASEVQSPGLRMIQRIDLSERNEGITRVEMQIEISEVSALYGTLMKIASSDLAAQLMVSVQRLKAVVEQPGRVLAPVERVPLKWSAAGVTLMVGFSLAVGIALARIL